MAPDNVERAVLDTNVLLAATDESRPAHAIALDTLNGWPSAGIVVYTSGQILREYLAVATRPVSVNGLGLSRVDALRNVGSFRHRSTLLTEDARVHDRLVRLIAGVDCTGRQVHDANIVATMLVHGVVDLVTANVSDFDRFRQQIRVIPLVEPAAEGEAG